MKTFQVNISNRGNVSYQVEHKRPLLDSLREQGVDLPYGCRYGGCISCAAKLIDGEVDQKRQVALNNCLLYTSPSPRDVEESRMPSCA